jgi:hypothetical protein
VPPVFLSGGLGILKSRTLFGLMLTVALVGGAYYLLQNGWVSEAGLMTSETHEAEERLLSTLSDLPVQATGHSADVNNIHIEPSRTAAVVAQVNPEQPLEILGRRLVHRFPEKSTSNLTVASDRLQAWYLVREASHAGWILGHRVKLDIPQSISAYADDTNLVAWLVLNKVNDNGHQVPQYVVADRAARGHATSPTSEFSRGGKRNKPTPFPTGRVG